MPPKSIWNGTISFGLAHVPVKLYSATESKTVSFQEVHVSDGARIEHKRVCSKDGRVVPYKQVVKGYEVSSGEFVVLDNDEVKAAAGARGKVIELEDFVPEGEIDPIFFEKTYYVGCREEAEAYRVLLAALERTSRVGIGRFTFHNREYLVAVRALDGVLALHTMRFHDEIVEAGDLDVAKPGKGPSKREVQMAGQLVESLHTEFDPDDYEDTYREAVLDLIEPEHAPPLLREAIERSHRVQALRLGDRFQPGGLRDPVGLPDRAVLCRAQELGTDRREPVGVVAVGPAQHVGEGIDDGDLRRRSISSRDEGEAPRQGSMPVVELEEGMAIAALGATGLVSVPIPTRLPRVCHHHRIRPFRAAFLPLSVGRASGGWVSSPLLPTGNFRSSPRGPHG